MPRGRKGTQMSGLPVVHMRGDSKHGTLCGRGRAKWGALTTESPGRVDCRRCLAKMAKSATATTSSEKRS